MFLDVFSMLFLSVIKLRSAHKRELQFLHSRNQISNCHAVFVCQWKIYFLGAVSSLVVSLKWRFYIYLEAGNNFHTIAHEGVSFYRFPHGHETSAVGNGSSVCHENRRSCTRYQLKHSSDKIASDTVNFLHTHHYILSSFMYTTSAKRQNCAFQTLCATYLLHTLAKLKGVWR